MYPFIHQAKHKLKEQNLELIKKGGDEFVKQNKTDIEAKLNIVRQEKEPHEQKQTSQKKSLIFQSTQGNR